MTELEMNNDVETQELADELSDEALDRTDTEVGRTCLPPPTTGPGPLSCRN